ncbi:unnamed protein product [Lepeophtheirus salmonis]|uniref:(salmon louse) hypothetical protein n=1 Tax=Lepeophtheirus salmonis TaxID=72036 RepID=A0A7R8D2X9_LEPSM|nr:unnamed protein product [Lepeophtheirus salmonis]CAF3009726.1 unnamed protein product [Lepeophtheirus salmonis]
MVQTNEELDLPQSIVQQLIPSANEYVGDFLHNIVEPIFQGILSSHGLPKDFNFVKVDLGTISPEFSNIKTHTRAKRITSGIKDLIMTGRGRVVLKPLTKKALPFFVGGAQIMLLDVPHLYFDLEGIAEVCDWPIIRNKIRKELYETIKRKIVYPNKCKFISIITGVDPMLYKAFSPSGMLAVKLNLAEGLPTKGGIIRSLIGQEKPDTFAKIILGAEDVTSAVIKNTTEPSWEEEVVWYEFLIEKLNGHQLRVELYDEDTLTQDEFLGEKTKYDIQGQLTLSMRWMPLGSGASQTGYEGPFQKSPEGCANAYCELNFEDFKFRTSVKKDTPHPDFNYGRTLKCGDDFKDKSVLINVKDESDFHFGTLTLPLGEYYENPIHRKIMCLNAEGPLCYYDTLYELKDGVGIIAIQRRKMNGNNDVKKAKCLSEFVSEVEEHLRTEDGCHAEALDARTVRCVCGKVIRLSSSFYWQYLIQKPSRNKGNNGKVEQKGHWFKCDVVRSKGLGGMSWIPRLFCWKRKLLKKRRSARHLLMEPKRFKEEPATPPLALVPSSSCSSSSTSTSDSSSDSEEEENPVHARLTLKAQVQELLNSRNHWRILFARRPMLPIRTRHPHVSRVQIHTHHSTQKSPPQRPLEEETSDINCCFYAFRKLKVPRPSAISVNGFLDPFKDPKLNDLHLWTPNPQLWRYEQGSLYFKLYRGSVLRYGYK